MSSMSDNSDEQEQQQQQQQQEQQQQTQTQRRVSNPLLDTISEAEARESSTPDPVGNIEVSELKSRILQLEQELENEKGTSKILRADVRSLKQQLVVVQQSAEQEEEFITNRLIKRIEQLKKEKGDLALEVEREEEFMTNTLQKKLVKLQQEKIDLENALEQEQERLVNRLQRQLDLIGTNNVNNSVTSPISANTTGSTSTTGGAVTSGLGFLGPISPSTPMRRPSAHLQSANQTPQQLGSTPSMSFASDGHLAPGMIEVLKAEIASLRRRLSDAQRDVLSMYSQSQMYKREMVTLRERLGLNVTHLHVADPVPASIRMFKSVVEPAAGATRAKRSMSTSVPRNDLPDLTANQRHLSSSSSHAHAHDINNTNSMTGGNINSGNSAVFQWTRSQSNVDSLVDPRSNRSALFGNYPVNTSSTPYRRVSEMSTTGANTVPVRRQHGHRPSLSVSGAAPTIAIGPVPMAASSTAQTMSSGAASLPFPVPVVSDTHFHPFYNQPRAGSLSSLPSSANVHAPIHSDSMYSAAGGGPSPSSASSIRTPSRTPSRMSSRSSSVSRPGTTGVSGGSSLPVGSLSPKSQPVPLHVHPLSTHPSLHSYGPVSSASAGAGLQTSTVPMGKSSSQASVSSVSSTSNTSNNRPAASPSTTQTH